MGIVASADEIDRTVTHARGAEGVVRVQSFLEATRTRALDDVPKIPEETANEPSVLP